MSELSELVDTFQWQLVFLSVVFSIGGILVAIAGAYVGYMQYVDNQRDNRRQDEEDQRNRAREEEWKKQAAGAIQRTDATMEQVTKLIAAMTQMTQLTNATLRRAQQSGKYVDSILKRRKQALTQIALEAGKFIDYYNRFDKGQLCELAEKARLIDELSQTHAIREDKLPASALLIRGHYLTLRKGDNPSAERCFGKVIDHKTATPQETKNAHFSRGIARFNQGKYDAAVEDFKQAEAKDGHNQFFVFWRLDSLAQLARKNPGLVTEVEAGFQRLTTLLNTRATLKCDPVDVGQFKERLLVSYASFLMHVKKDNKNAKAQLDQIPEHLFARYLRLICDLSPTGEVENAKERDECLQRAREQFERESEPRSKVLRGMILARVQQLGRMQDPTLIPRLLNGVDILRDTAGADATVFSPISHANEPLAVIASQIEDLRNPPPCSPSTT
jgi:tetratricopeptide (TPR) repeat protein